MSKAPKGKVSTLIPKSPAEEYYNPDVRNVATKITADDPSFVPAYPPGGHAADLVANLPNQQPVSLAHRMTAKVDCGFSMELPPGFRAVLSGNEQLANRGLMVTNPSSFVQGRVYVLVTNVGKEIIPIEHGMKVAQMSVEPAYFFEWVK
jgi:dUTPase